MTRFYSDPSREDDKWSLPDAEVFRIGEDELEGPDGEMLPPGWYYQFCLPGCMPDSEPFGPFQDEETAIEACREECALVEEELP